jgi:hypothetical protein
MKDSKGFADGAIRTLIKIDTIYWKSGISIHRKIISSIYPEKFNLKICNIEPPMLMIFLRLYP